MTITTITNGQSVTSGYTVMDGDTLEVLAGGLAQEITIALGGTADFAGTDAGVLILSGGSAYLTGTETDITIAAGGTETVAGGTITGGTIYGFQDVLTNTTGAQITGETVANGGTLQVDNKSNTVVSTTIETGGVFGINGNATGEDMVIAGGTIDLESKKAVLSGGLAFTGSGTLLESAVISSGYGDLAVISGFAAGDVIDLSAIGTGATLTTAASGGDTVIMVSGGSAEGTLSESFTFSGTGGGYTLSTDAGGTGEALTGSTAMSTGTTSSSIPLLTSFTAGDIVISVVGGVDGNTYTDNQAAPVMLEEIDPSTGEIVGEMELPQSASGSNNAFSGEYGSSSEGILQLSGNDQSLVIAGYGVNAATFNAGESNGNNVYGNAALAQSTSIEGGTYTAVARVIADISYNGSVDTSTALYNVFNTNNPRSVATVDGTVFYISGQGVKGDTTQGVFAAQDGASSATAIYNATDTRTAEIYDGTLYVSIDSTQNNTSEIASFGTLPGSLTAASPLDGIDGSVVLTAAAANAVNAGEIGATVALSPEEYFFANATTLYIADSGNPKAGTIGDGGLQKWILNPQTGLWSLAYTISAGLNLVANTASAGTTGLIGLTAALNADGTVTFYATNSTIGDLDQTYLYTVTDTVNATTLAAGTSFSVVETAAADTNIRGIAYAPSAPVDTTIPSGQEHRTGLTITNGSAVTVAAGGTLPGAVLLSGGTAYDYGTDTGSLIVLGGAETVYGTASADNVYGEQIVSGGVSGETVYYDGGIIIAAGGVAQDLTIETGGGVLLGGTATDLTLDGGILSLAAASAALTGTLDFSGGTLAVESIPASGDGMTALIENFGAGAVIELASFDSAATLSGMTAGTMTVETLSEGSLSESFTFATDFAANSFEIQSISGGVELLLGSTLTGTETVTGGQIAQDVTIAAGGTLIVLAGGTLLNGDLLSGGDATISGIDSGSTIAAGGTELVLGTVQGDAVYGTQILSSGTAFAGNETVYNGGALDLFLKGAVAQDILLSSGAALVISGNATAEDITIAGGGMVLESPKSSLSGSITFAGDGTITETALISAGYDDTAVISGFGMGDTIDLAAIGAGAALTSSYDGTNTTITIAGGAAEGTLTEVFTFAGTYAADFFALSAGGLLTENGSASESGLLVISSGQSAPADYTVANGGTLEVLSGGTANGVVVLSGGTAAFAGTDGNTTIEPGGSVSLSGTETDITIASGGTETVSGGTITGGAIFGFQDVLTNTTGASISNETVFNGGVIQIDNKDNTVSAATIFTGGTFAINGNASGNDMIIYGGVIDLESKKSNLTALTFAAGGTLLETAVLSAGVGGVFGVIEGFAPGDVIDLASIGTGAALTSSTDGTDTTLSVAGGSDETGEVESFTLAGTGLNFSLTPAGGTGEMIQEVYCYLPGTRILTPAGPVAVETLSIGDALVTRFGGVRRLKWIGIQRYAGRFLAGHPDKMPVRIKPGALGDGLPLRDLYVSPGHSMLIEGRLLLARNLVNGITVTQGEPPELVEYYALEFDTHDCVLAEGAFGESFADGPGFRNLFHNAAAFHALYPDYAAPEALALCAPRPEHGPELDAALRPLAARAAAQAAPGALHGYVERITPEGLVEGWAQDLANPLLPVLLEIRLAGQVLGSVLACDYRGDLRAAGIGTGRALFSFTAGRPLCAAARAGISVHRMSDGAPLALAHGLRAA